MSTAIEAADLKRYSDFTPLPDDNHIELTGGLSMQNEWFIAPCSITRDSDSLALSNWECQRKELEAVDTGSDFEVHRFGHWGPGWYEIVLVRPDSACHRVAAELAYRLDTYSVLDENDWGGREYEMAWEGTKAIHAIRDSRDNPLSERTLDILDNVPNEVLMGELGALEVEISEDYPSIRGSRAQWAAFLRAVRKAVRS